VSHDLSRQIDVENRQLRLLLETHAALLNKCRQVTPTVDERAALAAVLHAFYNGIENVFKRVALALDGGIPGGLTSHSDLLTSMSVAKSNRPALLSESLYETLQEYLDFRHVFRHSYSFELRWEKMKHLVLGLNDVFLRFEQELNDFSSKFKTL